MRVKTSVGRLPWWGVVGGNVVFWPVWTFVVGYLAHRVPDRHFESDNLVTCPRRWEGDGAWYRQRLSIHSWKDRLPEGGALFGGFAKRSIGSGDHAELAKFAVETRRAEQAHWAMLAGAALTTLWNPWWAWSTNVAVGAGSNLPCIAVQRYNRARLRRLLTSGR